MPAMIGFLMLMGLAAKNSILLVEFAIEDERAGQTPIQALMNALPRACAADHHDHHGHGGGACCPPPSAWGKDRSSASPWPSP